MSDASEQTHEPDSTRNGLGPSPNGWVVVIICLGFIAASGAILGSQGSLAAALLCATLWWLWAMWRWRRNYFALFGLLLVPVAILLLTPAIQSTPPGGSPRRHGVSANEETSDPQITKAICDWFRSQGLQEPDRVVIKSKSAEGWWLRVGPEPKEHWMALIRKRLKFWNGCEASDPQTENPAAAKPATIKGMAGKPIPNPTAREDGFQPQFMACQGRSRPFLAQRY